jgi:hypothetical protein
MWTAHSQLLQCLIRQLGQMGPQFLHYFLCLRFRQLNTEFLNLTLEIEADSSTREL